MQTLIFSHLTLFTKSPFFWLGLFYLILIQPLRAQELYHVNLEVSEYIRHDSIFSNVTISGNKRVSDSLSALDSSLVYSTCSDTFIRFTNKADIISYSFARPLHFSNDSLIYQVCLLPLLHLPEFKMPEDSILFQREVKLVLRYELFWMDSLQLLDGPSVDRVDLGDYGYLFLSEYKSDEAEIDFVTMARSHYINRFNYIAWNSYVREQRRLLSSIRFIFKRK